MARKVKAKLVLNELEIEKPEPKNCPMFKEYAEMCVALPHDWKESTRIAHRFYLGNHVYPVLKKRRLDEIRLKELKAFFDGLLAKELGPSTVNVIRAGVSGVLNHALDSELIENDPAHERP